MKKLASTAAAVLLGTLLATPPALAEIFNYPVSGCTKDGQTAALNIAVKGQSTNGSDVQTVLQSVWDKTVQPLTGDELMNPQQGFISFLQNMNDAWGGLAIKDGENDGDFGILAPPMVGEPACTPKM